MKHLLSSLLFFLSLSAICQNAPTLRNDTLAVCAGKLSLTDILDNDIDIDGDSIFVDSIFIRPQNGFLTNTGGLFSYTSNPNYVGIDRAYVRVCDNSFFKQCAFEFVVWRVDTCPVFNTAPSATNDLVAVCHNQSTSIIPLSNDSDFDGDSIAIVSFLNSANLGTDSFDNTTYFYTPSVLSGIDTITYVLCDFPDSLPSLCDTASIIITINDCTPLPNRAPTAFTDTFTICHTSAISAIPIINDSDIDGDSIGIISFLDRPLWGVDSFVGNVFYYTPNTLSGTDSLRYVLCDFPQTLPQLCDTGLIIINVVDCTPLPNQAPQAQIDAVIALEDFTSFPFDPRDNDTDPDGDPLTWTPLFGPLNGTVSQVGTRWIYRPNPNFNGLDFMPYRVCDNGTPQLCAFSAVVFTIAPRNDAPVAVNDSISVLEDERTLLNLLDNDIDVDGDALRITRVNSATNGTVELINGQVFYTSNLNFFGTDQFRYRICDSTNACSEANVYITVLPVDDAPVAVDDSVRISALSNSLDVTALLNDYDVEGDSFWISNVSNGSIINAEIKTENGRQVIALSRSNNEDCGQDAITYEICGSGGCSSALVMVNVGCQFTGKLPEGFSPGNDGINDKLIFNNLDDYRPLNLKVFNRWGDVVYETRDYENDWAGTHKNQPVPDGTYFYILMLNTDEEHIRQLIIQR
jgi:gliding motility-associated-like protein